MNVNNNQPPWMQMLNNNNQQANQTNGAIPGAPPQNSQNQNQPLSSAIFERADGRRMRLTGVNPEDMVAALQQSERQGEAFMEMVRRLLNQQGHTARLVDGRVMIDIDEATRTRAQAEIAEDGYFGVAQTSERILSFARAFAGNDEGRINQMQSAFLRGFEAASRAWGGELPEISQQTFDAVMQGFADMRTNAGVATT
jgi:hypothetical protein